MGIFDRFKKKREEEFSEIKESVLPSELRELKEKISLPMHREPPTMQAKTLPHVSTTPQTRDIEKPELPKPNELSFPPIGLDIEVKPREPEIPGKEETREEIKTELEHKIEMILTKLDLLNERVKVIEEKLERKGII